MSHPFVTTIEITDSHIKLLQAAVSHAGITLTYCDIKEIIQYSDQEVSKLIAAMVAAGKIRPANLIGVIPRRFAILRHLTLPSHAPEEIKKMVGLQIIKQVPYPREDVILDYVVLHKEPSGYAKVLVIAVHKEVIGRYLRIFNEAGLTLNKLTLSSAGLLSWYAFEESRSKQKNNAPTVIINVDTLNTEICFCDSQKLLFSRSVNFGARDLHKESIVHLVEEIGLTMATYTKENIGEGLSRIILVASVPEITLLKEKIDAEYKATVETAESINSLPQKKGLHQYPTAIETVNPLTGISQKKGFRKPLSLEQAGVSLAVGIGLALAKPADLINLLPSEVSDTRATRQKRKEWFKLIVLVAVIFFLAAGSFAVRIYKRSMYLQALQKKISEAEPTVIEIKEKMRRLDFIKEKFNPPVTSIDIIYALYSVTPPEVSFSVVYLEENGVLNLQGASETGTAVNNLQRNLANSPFFDSVTLQYATKRRIFKGELTDFKITCHVAKGKGAAK